MASFNQKTTPLAFKIERVYFSSKMKKNTTFKDESQNTEYKETWRDEYLKWVCGFANAQGGRIYIGIDDNKKVVGVKGSKKAKYNHTWDSLPIPGTSIEDIDNESVEYFVNRGIRLGRLPSSILGVPAEQILKNLNLISKDGTLTNAAMLLFGRNPQAYFVGAIFRIGRFRDDEADILFQDEIAGNLIHMPDTVMDYLKGKYLKSYIHFEGLQRIEKLEIPEDGLREILCNAIVHKDYRGVHTQMKVYDDHIRLWNEGGLIDGMTIESLRKEHNSRPRNKLIAQVFYLAGFIETWGRGIWKVDKAFASESLPVPEYEENSGGVVVVVPRNAQIESENKIDGPVNGPISEPINGPIKQLLELIKEKPKSNYEEYCSLMVVSRSTLKRYLDVLKKEGFIERVGANKNGYWKVLK